jgi:nucleotide-binding universal stress UspA family protein
MFQKILVAIDNPQVDWLPFRKGVELAKQFNAQLMLFHVVSPDEESHRSVPVFMPYDYPAVSEEFIKQYLQERIEAERQGLNRLRLLATKAEAEGVTAEISQSVGMPGLLICNMAISWNADLIIMGRKGRLGLSELLLGSVSNYVLHHAPCSVLTIQGHAEELADEQFAAEMVEAD